MRWNCIHKTRTGDYLKNNSENKKKLLKILNESRNLKYIYNSKTENKAEEISQTLEN